MRVAEQEGHIGLACCASFLRLLLSTSAKSRANEASAVYAISSYQGERPSMGTQGPETCAKTKGQA